MVSVRTFRIAVVALISLMTAAPPAAGWSLTNRDSLVSLYNELGVINALNEDMEAARDYFDSALILAESDPGVLNNMGNYYLCSGYIDSAILMYRRAESVDTTDHSMLFNWAVALYMAKETEASVELMKDFLESLTDPTAIEDFSAVLLDDLGLGKASDKNLGRAEVRVLLEEARKQLHEARKRERDTIAAKGGLAKNQPDSTQRSAKKTRVIPAGAKHDEYRNLATVLFWVW
jgi:tetratricopeptide (TPR) repeat protein